jgi:O-antigen ligase
MVTIKTNNTLSVALIPPRNNIFFYCFLAFLVSDIARIQELYPVLASILFQKVLGIITVVGVLRDPYAKKRLGEHFRTTKGKVMLFFFFWMVMSIPFSIYPGNSFRFLTEYFWKVILIYVLTLAYTFSYERLIRTIWGYILGVSLLGVFYYSFGGTSSRGYITTSYDPNDLAFVVVVGLAFVFYKLFSTRGFKNIFIGLLCILMLVTIVKTQSRGGFLGLFAITVVILWQLRKLGLKYFVASLILCSIGGGLLLYIGDSQFWNRMSTILNYQEDYNLTEISGRIGIWERGIGTMIANPLLGVGVNNFFTADGLSGGRWNAAHNSFLEIGVDLGFPGLICFCFIILNSLTGIKGRSFFQNKKASNNYILTQYSIVSSWVGFITAGFFLSMSYSLPFYFLAAVSSVFKTVVSDSVLATDQDSFEQKVD